MFFSNLLNRAKIVPGVPRLTSFIRQHLHSVPLNVTAKKLKSIRYSADGSFKEQNNWVKVNGFRSRGGGGGSAFVVLVEGNYLTSSYYKTPLEDEKLLVSRHKFAEFKAMDKLVEHLSGIDVAVYSSVVINFDCEIVEKFFELIHKYWEFKHNGNAPGMKSIIDDINFKFGKTHVSWFKNWVDILEDVKFSWQRIPSKENFEADSLAYFGRVTNASCRENIEEKEFKFLRNLHSAILEGVDSKREERKKWKKKQKKK